MKRISLFLCVLVCFFSCQKEEVASDFPPEAEAVAETFEAAEPSPENISDSQQVPPSPPVQDEKATEEEMKRRHEVEAYHNYMHNDGNSYDEVIAQMFMCGFEGEAEFDKAVEEVFGDVLPGALLLFEKNCGNSPEELIRLTEKIFAVYDARGVPAPFLVIDNEGGDVNRLRKIAAPLPSAELVSGYISPEDAKLIYEYSARQLRALGFHINLAPVVEVKTEDNGEFLGTRSYGDLAAVEEFAGIFTQAQLDNGILPVFKHFPGNTNVDPHTDFPILDVTEEEFREKFLPPFKIMVEKFPNTGVLLSHAAVPAVGNDGPASIAPMLVKYYLENVINFKGLVISDDMQMGAMEKFNLSMADLFAEVMAAGVDMIMLTKPENFQEIIEQFKWTVLSNDSLMRNLTVIVREILLKKEEMGMLQRDENNSYVNVPLEDFDTRLKKFIENRDASLKIYTGK